MAAWLWWNHDSFVYATFPGTNCHSCCGNIYRVVYTPTVLNNLFSWWFFMCFLVLVKSWKWKPLKWKHLKCIPSHRGMYEIHRPCPQAVVWADRVGDEGDWMAGWHGSTPRPSANVALRWLVRGYEEKSLWDFFLFFFFFDAETVKRVGSTKLQIFTWPSNCYSR